jgi:uncharacterized protein YbbC (DUF1343 family)
MKFSKPTLLCPAKLVLLVLWAGSSLQVDAQFAVRAAQDFDNERIQVGAERMEEYLPLLADKRVAVVTNQTGMVGAVHLIDTLLSRGVKIKKVFAPEHGFRGAADAGEHVSNSVDKATGLPIISLYGSQKKPSQEMLEDVDVILFDIQDVGVRFYTYISTMHYCMEAAAKCGKQMLVLDRPNPNGFYVDGPIMEEEHRSFVGMHPIPLVHGLTVGELAKMINGEGWLKDGLKCVLTVISCGGYRHDMFYSLPVTPSPNLPNMTAVYLYPSLGLFEGTDVSVGRGTDFPFQCIGHPDLTIGTFTFTPKPTSGASNPPHKGMVCKGFDLRKFGSFYFRDTRGVHLEWLLGCYENRKGQVFFNDFFTKLAGTGKLRSQIESGATGVDIKRSWAAGLKDYRELRGKYLLYPEK